VLYRLKEAGYESYLVGGGVRDLLLGLSPKDFDIATRAHPEVVHKLFHHSRLIGRRFKLVHVVFGREVIEVATFRGEHIQPVAQSEEGMLLRDNVYGTVEEDAVRRDFTVNALYYSIEDFGIHDFVKGTQDLNNRRLRLIGDPETRYREDPVRMLRAVRFATKLDFSIDPAAEKPIPALASLMENIPAARLFDEVLKLFMTGHAQSNFKSLKKLLLFPALFPVTAQLLDDNKNPHQKRHLKLIQQALINTDLRIKEGKPTTPAFLYAAILWPAVEKESLIIQQNAVPPFPAMQQAAQRVIFKQTQSTSIPKRFAIPMKEIWELQLRLPKHRTKKPELLTGHPRFRAAYDFLLLREESGEKLNNLGLWWTDYQKKHPVASLQQKKNRKFGSSRSRRPYANQQ